MSQNGFVDPENELGHDCDGVCNGNGSLVPCPMYSKSKLQSKPNSDHQADSYDDLQLNFNPLLFSSLEKFLPSSILNMSRDIKVQYMQKIFESYSPVGDRDRVLERRVYRQRVIQNYQPLNRELYAMDPTFFFVPSFIKAINDNSEESFRTIISEPFAGIYTFEMLQPQFCELLLAEVEHFERWVQNTKFNIVRPNMMNKYGAVLDDFGLQPMLGKLMEDYILPLSRVFFGEVGGSTLDAHHGFVVEYGLHRDVGLGFHVDDSEVTLNVCLGKEFSGGELFFRGVRCEEHVNTEIQPQEIFDYPHVPGRAVLHHGNHRHGARATVSGSRINLLLWCKSSLFREMKTLKKNSSSSWCGECQREKIKRTCDSIASMKKRLMRREVDSASCPAS